jgi:hypothetical protein
MASSAVQGCTAERRKNTMGSHPIMLAIRFLLELAALLAMGFWGWKEHQGWFRVFPALAVPLIAAALWITFAVPGDPSRSGSAPIAVPGSLRLALELMVFAFAAWALYDAGSVKLSAILGGSVCLHYLASYDRVRWLVTR